MAIMITRLPSDMTDAQLLDVFCWFGTIVSHKMSCPGVAIVEFQNSVEAKWCVEHLDGDVPHGLTHPIAVTLTSGDKGEPDPEPRERSRSRGRGSGSGYGGGGASSDGGEEIKPPALPLTKASKCLVDGPTGPVVDLDLLSSSAKTSQSSSAQQDSQASYHTGTSTEELFEMEARERELNEGAESEEAEADAEAGMSQETLIMGGGSPVLPLRKTEGEDA